jgi:hypothetical protein
MTERKIGYKQVLDTLTGLDSKITKQSYYNVDLPQYIDFETGKDPFKESIAKNRVYHIGDTSDWFSRDSGGENLEIKKNDIEQDMILDFRHLGIKAVSYEYLDLEKLAVSQNYDAIEQKLSSRKESADLLLQEILFNGNKINKKIKGLLNLDGITVDATTITEPISEMDTDTVRTIASKLVAIFRANCGKSAVPNTFVIPESDYILLNASNDATYQHKTRLQYLIECFEGATAGLGKKEPFKILPTAYSDTDVSPENKGKYELYHRDPDTLVYDIPIAYTTRVFQSEVDLNWRSVAYLQVGGIRLFKSKEFIQFINPNA